ncbi:MAG: HlyD family secretion protein [Clostridium sp.]|jgi:HlyD family secretion protein
MKEFFSKKYAKYAVGALLIVVVFGLYKSPIIQNRLAANAPLQKTATVKKGDIKLLVTGTGYVYYDKASSIVSKVSSKVTNIYFEEGDSVKKGDLICEFDDSDAQLNLKQRKNDLVTNRLSNSSNDIQIDKLSIETPFAGQISNIIVKNGDIVQKGGELFTIADNSKLRLSVEFNATDINKISVNQAINVNLTSLMQTTTGIVTYKSNKAISTSAGGQLYTVEIQINNPGGVTEGMDASASMEAASGNLASTNSATLECIKKTTVISETGGTVNSIIIKKNQQVSANQNVITINNDDALINKEIGNSRITDSEIQIASSENQLRYYKIYAPIDGIIAVQSMKVGNSVSIGDPLTTIEEKSVVQADVDIDELDISKVAVGQKVQLTVDAIMETIENPIEGEVVKIPLDGISKNGVTNFAVTVRINERREMLRGGMNVSAAMEAKAIPNVLYLPKEAVTKAEGKSTVMVQEGTGDAVQKLVEVGVSNGFIVQIKSGLNEGDVVILPEENK